MAIDQRNRDYQWSTRTPENHYEKEQYYRMASLATLMDIRDELHTLNRLLGCKNFTDIPATLRGLRRDIKAMGKAAK
jgi:hypothetical protein